MKTLKSRSGGCGSVPTCTPLQMSLRLLSKEGGVDKTVGVTLPGGAIPAVIGLAGRFFPWYEGYRAGKWSLNCRHTSCECSMPANCDDFFSSEMWKLADRYGRTDTFVLSDYEDGADFATLHGTADLAIEVDFDSGTTQIDIRKAFDFHTLNDKGDNYDYGEGGD